MGNQYRINACYPSLVLNIYILLTNLSEPFTVFQAHSSEIGDGVPWAGTGFSALAFPSWKYDISIIAQLRMAENVKTWTTSYPPRQARHRRLSSLKHGIVF